MTLYNTQVSFSFYWRKHNIYFSTSGQLPQTITTGFILFFRNNFFYHSHVLVKLFNMSLISLLKSYFWSVDHSYLLILLIVCSLHSQIRFYSESAQLLSSIVINKGSSSPYIFSDLNDNSDPELHPQMDSSVSKIMLILWQHWLLLANCKHNCQNEGFSQHLILYTSKQEGNADPI